MGNFLRRSSPVHPARNTEAGYKAIAGEKKGSIRIKVRMRRDKLEELMSLAQSNGDGYNKSIGFLILKECMEGRLPAKVIGSSSGEDVWSHQRCESYLVARRLSSIIEE